MRSSPVHSVENVMFSGSMRRGPTANRARAPATRFRVPSAVRSLPRPPRSWRGAGGVARALLDDRSRDQTLLLRVVARVRRASVPLPRDGAGRIRRSRWATPPADSDRRLFEALRWDAVALDGAGRALRRHGSRFAGSQLANVHTSRSNGVRARGDVSMRCRGSAMAKVCRAARAGARDSTVAGHPAPRAWAMRNQRISTQYACSSR